jgi:chromosome segregation ATPase
MPNGHPVAIVFAALLLMAGAAQAQIERSGGGETQKMLQQYQQLAAERTTLMADNAKLKKDLDAAKAELAAAKKERDVAKASVAASLAAAAQANGAKDNVEKTLDVSKQRFNELVARYRELAQNLKDTESERTKVRGEFDARNRAFDTCAESNQQLFEINNDLLDREAHTGLFTRVSASEPFTRITHIRLDNLVVETRERVEQLRVKKREAEAPPVSPAAK